MPRWQLPLTVAAVAVWFVLVYTGTAHANDCVNYIKDISNFATVPKGLIEDCMRTGYVQALTTAAAGLAGGAAIVAAIQKAINEWYANNGGTAPGTTTMAPPVAPGDDEGGDGGESGGGGEGADGGGDGQGEGEGEGEGGDGGNSTAPPPDDSKPVFENDTCSHCGADLPDPPPPNGLCPHCGTKNPLTMVGSCPVCHATINLDDGYCPACKARFTPPDAPGSGPQSEGDPVFANDDCVKCGAALPHPPPPGGLCPACGAQNQLTMVGECPNCHKRINLDEGVCPACKQAFTPPENPNGPPKDSGTVFENDDCVKCGAPLPHPPPPGGVCPACGTTNTMTMTGTCPGCGKTINVESGYCPACKATFKPPENPNGPPKDASTVFENDACAKCGATLPHPPPPGGVCPACGTTNALTQVGTCPGCGKTINIDDGSCPACKTKFTPPENPNGPPKDSTPVFANDRCSGCGAELPHPPTPGGLCPACGVKNSRTMVGTCPGCGKTINLDDGECPACKTRFKPPAVPGEGGDKNTSDEALSKGNPPSGPGQGGDAKQNFQYEHCNNCMATLPSPAPANGLCPACGSKNALAGGTDQTESQGGSTTGNATQPPPPTQPTQPTPPTPPPEMKNQSVISGDAAAKLLEQSGLAKVTRDEHGNILKIEEAYPGAFDNLNGKDVTLVDGRTEGGTGPDWVSQSQGQITGIGWDPAGTGKPVIVVNHTDSTWQQQAPPPPPPVNIMDEAVNKAREVFDDAVKQVDDNVVKPVQDTYNDYKKQIEQGDLARGVYTTAKFMGDDASAEKLLRDYAKEHNLDADQVMKVAKMDDTTWKGIKAAFDLPDTIGKIIK